MKIRQPIQREVKQTTRVEHQVRGEIASSVDVPKPKALPDYDQRYKPISTYIVECDVEVEWKELREWIRQKAGTIPAALKLLSERPDMSIRARRLSLVASRETKSFEIDWKDKTQVLRDAAREYWEQRKSEGMRKQITNDMIDDWIIEHYGDTWKEMYLRLEDMKSVQKLIEHLSDQIDKRDADLRRIVDKLDQRNDAPAWTRGQQHERK